MFTFTKKATKKDIKDEKTSQENHKKQTKQSCELFLAMDS